MLINKRFKDSDGKTIGAVSMGDSFTIVWQQGPTSDIEADRTGALLSEVLKALIPVFEDIRSRASVLGFTLYDGTSLMTLKEILSACIWQAEERHRAFPHKGYDRALNDLRNASRKLFHGKKYPLAYIEASLMALKRASEAEAIDALTKAPRKAVKEVDGKYIPEPSHAATQVMWDALNGRVNIAIDGLNSDADRIAELESKLEEQKAFNLEVTEAIKILSTKVTEIFG
jgi:hypothetical protein